MFKKGFSVLALFPDNTLLVAVNKYWAFLLRRMHDGQKPVVIAVLDVVTEITTLCGDFVGQRFSTDLWPLLLEQFQYLRRYEEGSPFLQLKNLDLKNSKIDWSTGGSLEAQLKNSMLQCTLSCTRCCFIERACVTQMCSSVIQFLNNSKYQAQSLLILQELMNHDAGETAYWLLEQLSPNVRREWIKGTKLTAVPNSTVESHCLLLLNKAFIT